MAKDPDGLWTGTSTAAFRHGAWRYHFRVDGMDVPDPRNVLSSPFQHGTESLLVNPGDISETRPVPHARWHVSTTMLLSSQVPHARCRSKLHVAMRKYACLPSVLSYSRGGETDYSWSTVGRAGDILDNLIAAGKAQPMIIVSPAVEPRLVPTS